jgi:hypothetical protein
VGWLVPLCVFIRYTKCSVSPGAWFSVTNVVCQVEVSATGRLLVQRSLAKCVWSSTVIMCNINPLHLQEVGRRGQTKKKKKKKNNNNNNKCSTLAVLLDQCGFALILLDECYSKYFEWITCPVRKGHVGSSTNNTKREAGRVNWSKGVVTMSWLSTRFIPTSWRECASLSKTGECVQPSHHQGISHTEVFAVGITAKGVVMSYVR